MGNRVHKSSQNGRIHSGFPTKEDPKLFRKVIPMNSSDNKVKFQCNVCTESRVSSEIVSLSCAHKVCLICLDVHVHDNLCAHIRCPVKGCVSFVTDFSVRKVLRNMDTSKYEQCLLAELPHTYTCLLPECGSVVEYQDANTQFECPNCQLYNCIFCNTAHRSVTCDDRYNYPDVYNKICQEEMENTSKRFAITLVERRRKEIIHASNINLIANDLVFECFLCFKLIGKGVGVTLRQCFHNICKNCLKYHIKNSEYIPILCPCDNCMNFIEDREIAEILNEEEYRHYEKKSFDRIKLKLENCFKCKTVDCACFSELQNKNSEHVVCSNRSAANCRNSHESCMENEKQISNCPIGGIANYIETHSNDTPSNSVEFETADGKWSEPNSAVPSAPPAPEIVQRIVARKEVDCCICLTLKANVLLMNCGHICCCKECSLGLRCCPLCRENIFRQVDLDFNI